MLNLKVIGTILIFLIMLGLIIYFAFFHKSDPKLEVQQKYKAEKEKHKDDPEKLAELEMEELEKIKDIEKKELEKEQEKEVKDMEKKQAKEKAKERVKERRKKIDTKELEATESGPISPKPAEDPAPPLADPELQKEEMFELYQKHQEEKADLAAKHLEDERLCKAKIELLKKKINRNNQFIEKCRMLYNQKLVGCKCGSK